MVEILWCRNSVVFRVTDAAGNSASSSPVSFVYDNNNTLTVDDTPANNPDFPTIQQAVVAATSGDTISIADGNYVEVGQIVINKNLTLTGANKNTVIIKPANDTTGGNSDSAAWILVEAGNTFNLSGVTLDGDSLVRHINFGIASYGNGTISGSVIRNIKYGTYSGRGIVVFGSMTITNNLFEDIERIGVHVRGAYSGPAIGNALITYNLFYGKGSGDFLDYGVEVGAGATATISSNIISGNRGVASSDGSTSAGILVTDYYGTGTTANIIANTISNSTDGIAVGYLPTDASVVIAHNNKFIDDGTGVNSTGPAVNGTENWWNSSTGPAHATNPGGLGTPVSNYVDYSPWCTNPECTEFGSNDPLAEIVLDLNPTAVTLPGSSAVTVTGKDAAGIVRVNDNSTQVSLTADAGASFPLGTLITLVNGVGTSSVTNSVASTVNVTATEVGGSHAATGQVVFSVVTPTGISFTWEPQNNFAEANNSYLSGWHYVFRVTVYDTEETEMFVKFSDWLNTASEATVPVSPNTRLLINEAGGIVAGVGTDALIESGFGTVKSYALGNDYVDQALGGVPTPINISAIDNDSTAAGRQVQFDVFTKIPLGTPAGFYQTDFGILTQVPVI